MKRNLITIALFAAFASSALATKPKPKPAPSTPSPSSTAQAEAIAAAVAVAMQKQIQAQAQLQAQQQNARTGDVDVQIAAQERDPVASAGVAGLTSSGASTNNGTCFGSASGGVQGAAVGFAFGSTTLGEGCERRYDSAHLYAMGFYKAAIARMCQGAENRKAMEEAGTPCPTAPAAPAQTKTACATYTGNDPIVKRRNDCTE